MKLLDLGRLAADAVKWYTVLTCVMLLILGWVPLTPEMWDAVSCFIPVYNLGKLMNLFSAVQDLTIPQPLGAIVFPLMFINAVASLLFAWPTIFTGFALVAHAPPWLVLAAGFAGLVLRAFALLHLIMSAPIIGWRPP